MTPSSWRTSTSAGSRSTGPPTIVQKRATANGWRAFVVIGVTVWRGVVAEHFVFSTRPWTAEASFRPRFSQAVALDGLQSTSTSDSHEGCI